MTIARRSRTFAIAMLLSTAFVGLSGTAGHAAAQAATGPWHLLDGSGKARTGAPVVWENASHVSIVLWYRQLGSNDFTYQTTTMSAKGKPAVASTDVFAGQHWGSLSFSPTLLPSSGHPLVVFDGARGTSGFYSYGCVYGAQGGTNPWTLQNWSLSADCVNPIGAAAENGGGTLMAVWPGSPGVRYRIGTSLTAPASGTDSQINLNGATAAKTGAAADIAGSGQFYVAWTQANSTKDGLYVKDVTANSATVKVPNTGTNSTTHMQAASNVPMANRNTHSGVYLAYCANGSTCSLQLWRVGAAKAMGVPKSSGAYSEAVSAGPSGRMWVAWFNGQTDKVSIVRTNKNVSSFGPVQTFSTSCAVTGLLGLSGGSSGRVDVALECGVNKPGVPTYVYATQVLVPLSVSLSPTSVRNTAAHTITVTVRDAGDPVAHATVRYGTQHPTTNSSGRATIQVAKGTSTGTKHVTVSATDYRSAGATFHVTH